VENLLWIKNNAFYREALDDWKAQKNSQGEKIGNCQKNEREVINEIYNLIGFLA
jgi:hypothetical protein